MGLEVTVGEGTARSLAETLAALEQDGLSALVAMVDGQLCSFGAPPPAVWREARLRTPAGTVTLVRRGGVIAVVVFGNADAALVDAQGRVARALAGTR
ncbi:MAG: hypothetical protein EXR73_07860 [Myxococcales bacterium]|nr:hypothetical protein [Myxococcales bacterium]